jgi:hypothetical protein
MACTIGVSLPLSFYSVFQSHSCIPGIEAVTFLWLALR